MMRSLFTFRSFAVGASLGLVIALVYIANFGVWMNRNLADSDAFVGSTVDALETESSREAMASIVVGRLVEGRPILAIASPLVEDFVADLLDSDGLESALTNVGTRMHEALFDGSQDGIVIALPSVGDRVMPPLERFFPAIADEVPSGFFDEIVLVEPGTLPELSPYADALQRVTWIAVLLAAAAMALFIWMASTRWKAVAAIGGAVTVAGVLSVVLVNRARSLTIATPRDADVEVLVINLYDQMAGGLRSQGWVLVVVGLVVLVAGIAIGRSSDAGGDTQDVRTS